MALTRLYLATRPSLTQVQVKGDLKITEANKNSKPAFPSAVLPSLTADHRHLACRSYHDPRPRACQ